MSENTDLPPTTGRPEPLTIKELARLAGVSIGTVDRVLHKRGRVSEANQRRIEDLVAERGYTPNVLASRLSSGGARRLVIGVLLPRAEQDQGYWSLLHEGLEQARHDLAPVGVALAVETFDRRSPDECEAAFRRLLGHGCHALALAPIHSGVVRALLEAHRPALPTVCFDTDLDTSVPHGFVGQDPWQSGRLAGRLMHQSLPPGRSALLVRFAGDDEHLARRADGFASFLAEQGRLLVTLQHDVDAPPEAAQRAVAEQGRLHPSLGGLFVPNATVARFLGGTPGWVAIGYDLIADNVAALRSGDLQFLISQRPEAMSREALAMLSRCLHGVNQALRVVPMPIEIIVPENLPVR